MEVKLSLINKIVPSLWHPKSTAINNPARLSLGVSGEGGGRVGDGRLSASQYTDLFWVCYKQQPQ